MIVNRNPFLPVLAIFLTMTLLSVLTRAVGLPGKPSVIIGITVISIIAGAVVLHAQIQSARKEKEVRQAQHKAVLAEYSAARQTYEVGAQEGDHV